MRNAGPSLWRNVPDSYCSAEYNVVVRYKFNSNNLTLYRGPAQPVVREQHVACDEEFCCPRRHLLLLLTLSLTKVRQTTQEILHTYELFIYGDRHYIK